MLFNHNTLIFSELQKHSKTAVPRARERLDESVRFSETFLDQLFLHIAFFFESCIFDLRNFFNIIYVRFFATSLKFVVILH